MIADSSVQRMKGCDCKEYDILYRILYIQRVYILTNNGCVGPEVVLKSTQTKYLQLRSLYRRETCKESIGQAGPTVLADSSVQRMRGQQCLADSSVQRMRGRDCKECYSIHAQYTLHSASLLTNNGCVGPEVVLESFRKSTQTRYVQPRSRRRETCKDYICASAEAHKLERDSTSSIITSVDVI